MELNEIKKAVTDGKRVFWSNRAYEVICDSKGQYFIKCLLNGHCIGLTWVDGVTMNGTPEEFFVGE